MRSSKANCRAHLPAHPLQSCSPVFRYIEATVQQCASLHIPCPKVPSFALLSLTSAASAAPGPKLCLPSLTSAAPAAPAGMCTLALASQLVQPRCALTLQQICDRHAAAAHHMPPAATAVLLAGSRHDRPLPLQLPPTILQVSSAGGPATPATQQRSSAAMQPLRQHRRTGHHSTTRRSSSSTRGALSSNPLAGWRVLDRSGAQQRIELPAAPEMSRSIGGSQRLFSCTAASAAQAALQQCVRAAAVAATLHTLTRQQARKPHRISNGHQRFSSISPITARRCALSARTARTCASKIAAHFR